MDLRARKWTSPPTTSLSTRLWRFPSSRRYSTFSRTPEIVQLNPSLGLAQTAEFMSGMSWGMNTDLQALFLKLILPLAVENKVKQVGSIQVFLL